MPINGCGSHGSTSICPAASVSMSRDAQPRKIRYLVGRSACNALPHSESQVDATRNYSLDPYSFGTPQTLGSSCYWGRNYFAGGKLMKRPSLASRSSTVHE